MSEETSHRRDPCPETCARSTSTKGTHSPFDASLGRLGLTVTRRSRVQPDVPEAARSAYAGGRMARHLLT